MKNCMPYVRVWVRACVCVYLCVFVWARKMLLVLAVAEASLVQSSNTPTRTYPLVKPTRQANAFSWEKSCNLARFFNLEFSWLQLVT